MDSMGTNVYSLLSLGFLNTVKESVPDIMNQLMLSLTHIYCEM